MKKRIPLLALALFLSPLAHAQAGRQVMQHALDLFQSEQPDAGAFIRDFVAADLVGEIGADTLEQRLTSMLREIGGAEVDDVSPNGADGGTLMFAGPDQHVVLYRFEPKAPHGIVDIWFEFGAHLDPRVPAQKDPRVPLTWANLEERLAQEEAAGFAGALYFQRDGEVVVREGFGMANQEKGIENRPTTVFGTGSMPIDYTRASILLLMDAGVVSLSDTLDAFFDDVPDDKRGITIAHLMSGRSGLKDFHGLPSDRDQDHAWIDRDEAVRRILGGELLFAPGTGSVHSHSAWGLIAAIVEVASGQSYRDFTRENLFEPLGMKDTGFYGDPVPEERLALGYGGAVDGEINAPPFWGPTSWLVLGSGGMTTTVDDMARWMNGLRADGFFSPEAKRLFWGSPYDIALAGSMYGFEVYYTEGPDTFFILLTNFNDGARRRANLRLARDILGLFGPSAPR